MMKKIWGLLWMASSALLMSCEEELLCKCLPPPATPLTTQLWVEPQDKSTGADLSFIRVGMSGEPSLKDLRDVDFSRQVKLIALETGESIFFDSTLETSVEPSNRHEDVDEDEYIDPRQVTVYVNVTPRAPLGDAWYALRVNKSAQWQPRGYHASDDGYLYYRFTTKTAPMLRGVSACQKEQDVKITLDYSEAILVEDERLEVSLAGVGVCERFGGPAGGAASQVDYYCRSARDDASLTLSGLKSVVAASDASTGLVGADELVVELSDVELISACRQVYLEGLPQ